MPKLKKESVGVHLGTGLGWVDVTLDLSVNADGEFYCPMPEKIAGYFTTGDTYEKGAVECRYRARSSSPGLYAKRKVDLMRVAKSALEATFKPRVETEIVIRYNIETDVSFSEDANGNIGRNGADPFEWPSGDRRKMFSREGTASWSRENGYVMRIGAQAFTKETKTIGDKVHVSYTAYRDTPAADTLNTWCNVNLSTGEKDAREIPYSDEAALFFDNLLMGMARLAQRLQDATFDREVLESNIAAMSGNLISFTGDDA